MTSVYYRTNKTEMFIEKKYQYFILQYHDDLTGTRNRDVMLIVTHRVETS